MYESIVLIADSDEARRRSRIDWLQGAGFRVAGAANASEILECAARYRPAVVLLSGTLPGPAPAELSRRLRARTAAPLLLSLASAESPLWEGADLYLREPLAPRELLATISTCLRLRRGSPRRRRIFGLRGTGQDITERKRMDEALRASEERLRFVLACSQAGAWELDLRTGAYIFSDEIYPLFGFDRNRKNLREADWLALIHPEDRDRVVESWLKDMSEASGPVSAEYRIIHSERGVRWICGWAGFERDETGRLVRVGGISFDITDRKSKEEKIRFQARLLDAVEQAIVVTDLDWRIIYWNPFAERLYGWRAGEVLGRDLVALLAPDFSEGQRNELMTALEGGRPVISEVLVRHRDGHALPILTTKSPVYDEQGRLVSMVCVSIDLTERKKAEESLRAFNESLALADRHKDEFLAMLAHGLRNPLAPIRNAVRIMRGLDPEDQATLDWARGVIDRQVGHLARLVDDLLDVSRLVRGRLDLRKEIVDLAEVVERALEVVRPLIQSHRHELVVSLPGSALWMEADPTRLTQVLENLLTNAAKYTPPGGRIRLEAEREGERAVIRVRDNGMGIPEDLLPHVFDLFTQNERSLDRSQGGLGIGLTIVKRLVEKHGGEIAVQSGSRGSEFTVRLPLSGAGAAPRDPPEARPRPAGAARRILVVDDNRDARDSLGLLLQLAGHEIHKAADGPAALAAALEFRPDVVLLDIGLPGMDGYEVARRLREQPATRGALLVAITGYGQPDDRLRVETAGFDHHLVKPVDPEALGRVLAEAGE